MTVAILTRLWYDCQTMNSKQREFVSKTFADIGKGLLLAVAVATMTNKAGPWLVALYLLMAVYAFSSAYRLEGQNDDSE